MGEPTLLTKRKEEIYLQPEREPLLREITLLRTVLKRENFFVKAITWVYYIGNPNL